MANKIDNNKFNFNSGDWELVNTKGQEPVGIDRGTYFIDNNKLYVFDFMSREINTQKEKRNEICMSWIWIVLIGKNLV